MNTPIFALTMERQRCYEQIVSAVQFLIAIRASSTSSTSLGNI